MKQKRSRDLCEKPKKRFGKEYVSPEGKHILPKGVFRKRFEGNRREADGGVPPVRFKLRTGLAGARRLRWSPALIHGEVGGSEGTYGFRVSFRVGGWWT